MVITGLLHFWGSLSGKSKIISSVAGAIAAIAGMVAAVPPAWTMLGLPEVATHSWVSLQVHEPMKLAQNQTQRQVIDLQLDVANGKLDQIDNARALYEIEKLKATDDAVKAKADAQIHKIDRDTSAIGDQIRSLKTIQGH